VRVPILILLAALVVAAPASGQASPWAGAAAYSREHRGDAVLVLHGDSIVFEEYQNGYRGDTPHMLASGSKSFSCVIAVAAVQDGILSLDEPVANVLTEFRGDSLRERITVRHLLNLSSGLAPGTRGFDGGPIRLTRRADALAAPMLAPPGTVFRYGPSHFDVFGELMRRVLNGELPDEFLRRKVLAPIGMETLEWRRDREGMPMLPGGAFTTAREWAKFGKLIRDEGWWDGRQILDRALVRECTTPSPANPLYGLTFWLGSDASADLAERRGLARRGPAGAIPVIMAAGAGIQRLYILRDENLVVVRLGRQDPRWRDTDFLALVRPRRQGVPKTRTMQDGGGIHEKKAGSP
jgi:CubicO group peptidase (beta-lactamase class C family)